MSIKTVFFDIENVQVFFSLEKMCQQFALCCRKESKWIQEEFFKRGLQKQWETGAISSRSIYDLLTKDTPGISFENFLSAANQIFWPNEEIFPILKALKKQKVRLITLSNICDAHYDYIFSTFPFLSLFDEHILSFQVGLRKPDPRIFQLALSKSQGPCFYTDDIEEYVLAARNQGLDSERFIDVKTLHTQLIQRKFLTPSSL